MALARSAVLVVLALVGVAWSAPAAAQVDASGAAYALIEAASSGGGEVDADAEFVPYGDVLVELRLADVAEDWEVALRAHLDTIDARATFGFGRWFVEPGLRMQRRYALLQHQVWAAGVKYDGYYVGYMSPRFSVGVRPADGHTVRLGVAYRKWYFDEVDGVVRVGAAPYNDSVDVFETRLSYTWWGVRTDPSLTSPAHPTPRVIGLTFTVELGLDARADVDQRMPYADTGSYDIGGGGLVAVEGPRTVRPTTVETIRQELHWGQPIAGPLRFQLSEWAGWGNDEDALTYARIGGSWSQYFVPLVGQPWGALLASRYLVAEPAVVVGVGGDHELAAFVDVAHVDDLLRSSLASPVEAGTLWGVGLRADLRFDAVQVDVRVGHSPVPDDWPVQRHWTAAIGFGFDVE